MTNLLSLKKALTIVNDELKNIKLFTKTIKTSTALNDVLATSCHSRLNLPAFNKSAMDGYSICEEIPLNKYKLIEIVAAGKTPTKPLVPGTTIKVMTGAPVPASTKKVIPIENTSANDKTITIITDSKSSNICKIAEDVKKDDIILPAYTQLGAIEIANLIACGVDYVKVFKKPSIAIISTGDELVDKFTKIAPGKIMNSNGPMLAALCQKHNLPISFIAQTKDSQKRTNSTIKKALTKSDILILSGGVSVGDFDFVATALNNNKINIHFNKLAVKPGKPMTFASNGQKLAFALPGNPVSVYLMFHLFVLRAIKILLNQNSNFNYISLPLATKFIRKKATRQEFVPAKITKEGTLTPITYHGSGHLGALLHCDGFFVVHEKTNTINHGQLVEFLQL